MPRIDSCLDLDSSFLTHLKKMKVFSVFDFISTDTDKLVMSSMMAKDILSLKHKLVSQCVKLHEDGALRYRISLKKSAVLPTHIKYLDDLLNGGLQTGYLYEITGLSGTGKSQLCFTIIANVVSRLKRKIFVLDSKADFSVNRIESILGTQNLSEKEVITCLEKIDVFRVRDLYEITSCIQSICESLQSSRKYDYRLLVLDSLTAPYLEFIGSQNSNEGYSLLFEVGAALKLLAKEMHLAIIVTNLAVRYSEGDVDFCLGDPEQSTDGKLRPAMGRPWAHVPHTRLSLQSTKSPDTFQITIVKSNCHPIGKSSVINISLQGVS